MCYDRSATRGVDEGGGCHLWEQNGQKKNFLNKNVVFALKILNYQDKSEFNK
jgi:hypothetical protein